MDLVSVPLVDNTVERKRKILQEYLGPFFVRPTASQSKKDKLAALFSVPKLVYPIYVRSRDDLNTVASYFLLSKKTRLFWKPFNTYELVQAFLSSENIVTLTDSFPYIIIYHTGHEMVNKRLPDLTKQVLEIRGMRGLVTLLISLVPNKEFGYDLIDIFGSVGESVDCTPDFKSQEGRVPSSAPVTDKFNQVV